MNFYLTLMTGLDPISIKTDVKRKRDDFEDSDSDVPSSPESSPRPRKIIAPSKRYGSEPGLPRDEPLDIDSRVNSIPPGRRPRARALQCFNHSWDCQICIH